VSESVHAVVPTRNNLAELQTCVASLQEQRQPVQQILVCVDGSVDGTVAWVRDFAEEDSRVRCLTHEGNQHRGRAATRNLALTAIRDGFVWFVDSDMQLREDALALHLRLAVAKDATSVGAVEYSNREASTWAGYLNTRGRHRFSDGEAIPYTQFTTANSLVPAEHFLALKGFDLRFGGYGGEDIEFALRLLASSRRPLVNNLRAVAETIEDKTVPQAMQQFESFGETNLHLIERLHPEAERMFHLQRYGSSRPADRLYRLSMNPATDALAELALRIGPSGPRYQALNYKVVRAVWTGYHRGADARTPT